jgi:DNA-binding transcriptional LysR family regulator
MTLKQIEDRVGVPLFESDRKSSVTTMGQFLLETGRILLRDFDQAMDMVASRAQARSGRLRLASVPSVATVLIPPILHDFLGSRPDVDVEFFDTDSTDVCHLVESGQAEIGIAGAVPAGSSLCFDPLFRDAFRLVFQVGSQLDVEGEGPITWDRLLGEKFILNEATRGITSDSFDAIAAEARMSVRNVASLVAMVQAGMGVTLLPALATLNLPDSIGTRPLADINCARLVGFYSREGRVQSPVAQSFRKSFAAGIRTRAHALGLTLAAPKG